MRRAVEEQRQKELDSSRRLTRAHAAVYGLFAEVAGEAQAIASPKLAHGVRIQGSFTRRQQLDPVQLLARALRVGIEMPDRIDVAVQQVDPVGVVGTHWKHIEQRAPHRELAMRHHLGDRCVAGQGQPRPERIQVQRLADMDLQGIGLHIAAGSEPLQQRVDGHQPHAAVRPRQFRERREPRRGDVGMRREAVVRQRLQIRKHPRGTSGSREERDLVAQLFGFAGIARDHDERTGRLGRGFRECECGSGTVQPAPFEERRCSARETGIS